MRQRIRLLEREEKQPVNQMDAVTNGLIGGTVASLLIIVGGGVALASNVWEKMSSPYILFAWLIVLSGLMIGQLYLTYCLVSEFAAAPSQTEKGVTT